MALCGPREPGEYLLMDGTEIDRYRGLSVRYSA